MFTKKPKPSLKDTHPGIHALLDAMEMKEVTMAGGNALQLSAEQTQALDEHLQASLKEWEANEQAVKNAEKTAKELKAANEKVEALQATLNSTLEAAELEATEDLEEGINALGAEITRLGKQPGDKPSKPKQTKEKQEEEQPDKKEEPSFETSVDRELKELKEGIDD